MGHFTPVIYELVCHSPPVASALFVVLPPSTLVPTSSIICGGVYVFFSDKLECKPPFEVNLQPSFVIGWVVIVCKSPFG